jgi:hypothetical protein
MSNDEVKKKNPPVTLFFSFDLLAKLSRSETQFTYRLKYELLFR